MRAALPGGARVVVAAMGPKMCALAGAEADGVFLNWMTPEKAAWARERVHEGAAEAGRDAPPPVFGYVRVAVGDDAGERLLQGGVLLPRAAPGLHPPLRGARRAGARDGRHRRRRPGRGRRRELAAYERRSTTSSCARSRTRTPSRSARSPRPPRPGRKLRADGGERSDRRVQLESAELPVDGTSKRHVRSWAPRRRCSVDARPTLPISRPSSASAPLVITEDLEPGRHAVAERPRRGRSCARWRRRCPCRGR